VTTAPKFVPVPISVGEIGDVSRGIDVPNVAADSAQHGSHHSDHCAGLRETEIL
jgi:hypothetical protein